MMSASKTIRSLGICIAVGCAGTQRLPPGKVVEFAGQRAQYHDVSSPKVNVCRADPALLQREFDEMNTLLGTFLDSTPAKPDPNVTPAQIEMLQSSSALLPAVRAYELELEKAGQCKFDKRYDFRDLLHRGNELASQAEKRIEYAPTLVNYLSGQKALNQWNSARPREMAKAQSRFCRGGRRRNSKPIVYYAFEDEQGKKQWFFCDGSRVFAAPGQPGEYTPGGRVKLPAKVYLDLAARYPSVQVNRAPRLPPLPAD
jgi:hypothetical protein